MESTDDKKRVTEQRLAHEREFIAEGKKAWERLNAGAVKSEANNNKPTVTKHSSFDYHRQPTQMLPIASNKQRIDKLRATLPTRMSEGTPYVIKPSDSGVGLDLADVNGNFVARAVSSDSIVEFFAVRRQLTTSYDKLLAFEREYLLSPEKKRRKIFEKYYKR